MLTLGELFSSLSQKAGIKMEDETLKQILSLSEMSQFKLPPEFSQALEGNLLTTASAVANADVRSKIMAEALNGVDARIETILGDFEFDDTLKGEIKGTKNTYEKLNKVTTGLKSQLQAAKDKAKQTKDPADKKEVEVLQAQVADANKQMENLKRTHQIDLENERAKSLNDKIDYYERSKLASKPLPKNGQDLDVNIQMAQLLVKKEAAKNGLKVIFDEAGNAVLKQRKDGVDVDYFVDNKKIDYDNFLDGVLAQNKFLQINDPAPPTNGTGNNFSKPQTTLPTNQAAVNNINQQLQQLGVAI